MITDHVPPEVIESLYKETKAMLDEHDKGGYSAGKACRVMGYVGHGKSIQDLFDDPMMARLTRSFNSSFQHGKEVFATLDNVEKSETPRNGFLHFDRYHRFKFLVYLTDVKRENAAFGAVPGSVAKGRELRESQTMGNYDAFKNRIELDFPELEITKDDVVYVEGKAGTIIVLDTDCFHLGGNVEKGERLLIRSHGY